MEKGYIYVTVRLCDCVFVSVAYPALKKCMAALLGQGRRKGKSRSVDEAIVCIFTAPSRFTQLSEMIFLNTGILKTCSFQKPL